MIDKVIILRWSDFIITWYNLVFFLFIICSVDLVSFKLGTMMYMIRQHILEDVWKKTRGALKVN